MSAALGEEGEDFPSSGQQVSHTPRQHGQTGAPNLTSATILRQGHEPEANIKVLGDILEKTVVDDSLTVDHEMVATAGRPESCVCHFWML